MKDIKKVLVCITPQSNSKRLIDKAYEIASHVHGELHILHVEKGDNLFLTADSTDLLQQLFNYGKELGGVVHGHCSDNVPETIISFIKTEKITNVLLGQPVENAPVKSMDIHAKLVAVMPYLDIAVLGRE